MTTFDKYVEGTDIMNYVTNTIAQLTGAVYGAGKAPQAGGRRRDKQRHGGGNMGRRQPATGRNSARQ